MTWKWGDWSQIDTPETGTGAGTRVQNKPHKQETKVRSRGIDTDGVLPSGEGELATTRDGPGDTDFWSALQLRVQHRAGRAEFDPEKGTVELNLLETIVQGSLLRWQFDPASAQPDIEWEHRAATLPAIAPMLARVGDLTAHGSLLGPGLGSANVRAGGQPVFRTAVDQHLCPLATPAPHGVGMIAVGASNVRVNGFPVARAGDVVMELVGGPNPVLVGCATVHAGAPAPPPRMSFVVPVTPDEAFDFIDVEPMGPITVDGLYGEAGGKAGIEGSVQDGSAAGRMKAELQGQGVRLAGGARTRVRLPWSGRMLEFTWRGALGVGCVGGEAKAIASFDDGQISGTAAPPVLVPRPLCTDAEVGWGLLDDPFED